MTDFPHWPRWLLELDAAPQTGDAYLRLCRQANALCIGTAWRVTAVDWLRKDVLFEGPTGALLIGANDPNWGMSAYGLLRMTLTELRIAIDATWPVPDAAPKRPSARRVRACEPRGHS